MKKFAITTVLGVALSLAGCIDGEDDGRGALATGTPMPEFSVTGPSGMVSAADLAGKRTVVILFRTTCPDCRRELPKVEAAFKAVGAEENIEFVAISKESEAVVAQYWAEAEYTLPYYIDGDGSAFAAFAVQFVPTLYIFGSDGKLVYAAIEDAEGLLSQIEKLR
jgi:peroxiredoxin